MMIHIAWLFPAFALGFIAGVWLIGSARKGEDEQP